MKKNRLFFLVGGFALVLTFQLVGMAHAVDHSNYGTVLERHVDGGYFDYEEFMGNSDSRRLLNQYLASMARVNASEISEYEALAFWMNLYNAATIKLIEKHYPVDSIREIGSWFSTPWEIDFVETYRGRLTLDQIEHEIIRPDFQEPRIHYALVCAARSCPPLRDQPYDGERLDQQLNDQAEQFLRSEMNRFSMKNGTLQIKLSSIFSWYGEDWGSEEKLVQSLQSYLPERYEQPINKGNYSVEYLSYDWELNQAPGPYQKVSTRAEKEDSNRDENS